MQINSDQALKIRAFKQLLGCRRVKYGVDFCLVHKYAQTRVLCHEVWADEIREAATEVGLRLSLISTYR